jgi:hypothetical protein
MSLYSRFGGALGGGVGRNLNIRIFICTRLKFGPCKACAAGKYKILAGDAACTDCGAGKTSLLGSDDRRHVHHGIGLREEVVMCPKKKEPTRGPLLSP